MEIQRAIAAALVAAAMLWPLSAASEVVDPPSKSDLTSYASRNGLPSSAVQDAAMTGWIAGLMHGCSGDEALWGPLFRAFVSAQEREGFSDGQLDTLRAVFDLYRGRSQSKIVPSDCTENLAQLLLDSASTRLRAWDKGTR